MLATQHQFCVAFQYVRRELQIDIFSNTLGKKKEQAGMRLSES